MTTNQNKAAEIAERNACHYPFKGNLTNTSRSECEDSALEMAEWKDHQFKLEKERLIEKAKNCVKQCSAMRDSFSDDEEMVEFFMKSMED